MASDTLWLSCPACGLARSVGFKRDAALALCKGCNGAVTGLLFPRAFAGPTPPPLKAAQPIPGDAVCFYDADQKATCLCNQCGVLVSDAWSASWGSHRVCLRCLEKLRESGRDSRYESERTMWDNICLLLSVAFFNPVFPYICVFTAPAALVLGLRAWNRPRSMVQRSRGRLIIALILASLQILGMLIAIYFIIQGIMSGGFD